MCLQERVALGCSQAWEESLNKLLEKLKVFMTFLSSLLWPKERVNYPIFMETVTAEEKTLYLSATLHLNMKCADPSPLCSNINVPFSRVLK